MSSAQPSSSPATPSVHFLHVDGAAAADSGDASLHLDSAATPGPHDSRPVSAMDDVSMSRKGTMRMGRDNSMRLDPKFGALSVNAKDNIDIAIQARSRRKSTPALMHDRRMSAAAVPDDVDRGSDNSSDGGNEEDDYSGANSCSGLLVAPPFAEALKHSSMFIFSGDNPVRIVIYNVTKHRIFEGIVILLILANCVVLALERPLEPEKPYQFPVEIFFTVAFTFEMLIKWVALGVFAHPGAYIRNSWNILDFIIVVFSWLAFHPSVSSITAFRALRVVRPLRSMNAVRGLQVLVIGLLSSLKGLVHVGILTLFTVLIFAILGVQLFGGTLRRRCVDVATGAVDEEYFCNPSSSHSAGYWGYECPSGYECRVTENPYYGRFHFDNVWWGSLTTLALVTFDEWTTLLNISLATVGAISFFYYFFATIMAGYFVPNLVLAVINDEFVKASEEADEQERNRVAAEQRAQQQRELKNLAIGPGGPDATPGADGIYADEEEDVLNKYNPEAKMTPEEVSAWRQTTKYAIWYRWERFRDALHDVTEGYPRLDSPFLVELLEREAAEKDRIRQERIAERRTRIERARGETSSDTNDERSPPGSPNTRRNRGKKQFDGAGADGMVGLADVTSEPSRGALSNEGTEGEQLSPQQQAEKEIYEEELEEEENLPTTLFAKIIIFFILLNTLVLASQHHDQPTWLDNWQTWANRILTGIFAVEFVMRMTALNPLRYAKDAFNVLDGLVVIVSIIELALSGSSTVSVFRALRLLRILKLLRSFPSLRQIIQVTLIAVKDTGYLLTIIALYLFIVALIGMQFFAGAIQDTRMVFDDFTQSFYTVFQILTFDGWLPLTYEAMERTSDGAVAYFVMQIIFGNYVLLSLFLSILLSSFDSLEQGTNDVVNENAIVYTLFDMSVAQSIFGRGAASKEELAEAAWIEPQRYINLNPQMQREYKRACHYLNKAMPASPGTKPTAPDGVVSEGMSEGGYFSAEPVGEPTAVTASRHMQEGTPADVGVSGAHSASHLGLGPSAGSVRAPHQQQAHHAPKSPGQSSLFGDFVVEEAAASRLEASSPAASPQRNEVNPHNHESMMRPHTKEAEREKLAQLAAKRQSLFKLDQSYTLTGEKKRPSKVPSATAVDNSPEAERKRRLMNLLGSDSGKKKKKVPQQQQQQQQQPAQGDEAGVTVLASEKPPEEKKKKENPEDVYCPVCRTEMPVPLPSAPLVLPPTRKELHKVQCHFISVRLAKIHVLDALVDIVTMYIDEGTPTKMKYVDPVVGQAWQVGLLLAETSETFVGRKGGWELLIDELEEEREIVELRVGEEQLGRSLIAYALGNVPTEHKTNGGNALFIFGPRNPIRIFCSQLVQNPWFDRVVLSLILLNTISMALDNPLDDPESDKVKTLYWVGVFFAACFTIEMLLKWVAFGVILHDGAYLRDSWNMLDGFIVLVTLIGYALEDANIGFLRVFRTLRALRPLRVINRNRGLKMVVRTLLESVKGIVNVGLICGINYLIFGILAVQFFGGRFQSCTDPDVNYKPLCNGTFYSEDLGRNVTREWRTEDRHFDDIYNAMLTLFEVSSGEWWGPVLYRAIDACAEDVGPQTNCNLPAGLFFIVFFSITGFFLINLFVGVVIHNFKMVKEQMDGSSFMTAEQKLWVSTQQLMLNFRPAVAMKPRKGSSSAELFHNRVLSRPLFDVFIGAIILANIIVIAMDHYGMSKEMEDGLVWANVVFSAMFFVEAAIKLFGWGLRYFRSGWNQFDFFLVVLSIIGIAFNFSGNGIGVDVSVLRVFRIFRILRVLRLVRQAKKIRILLETLWYSLPSMGNIGAFILLVDFIYGVLGVDIFAKLDIPATAEVLDTKMNNFRRLDNALIMLYKFQTIEEWDGAMRDAMVREPYCENNCGTPWAPLYFVTHLVITAFVITNLLIAIILDNFETTMKLDNSALRMSDLNRFVEIWSEFDDDANMTVPTAEFARLLAQLQPPLGLTRVQSRKELLSQTAKYRIPEHGGYIHFIETLIPLARTVKLEEEGDGQLQLTDFEVREHEAMWRMSFPHLEELPTLRYRETTVTVDQYYCSTYIGAAFRSRVAKQRANAMRYEKVEEIMKHCDENAIPYEEVPYLRRFMDFYAEIRTEQELERHENEAAGRGRVTNAEHREHLMKEGILSPLDKEHENETDEQRAEREAKEDLIMAGGGVKAQLLRPRGADKHVQFMSTVGQLPRDLKRAARLRRKENEGGVIKSASLAIIDNDSLLGRSRLSPSFIEARKAEAAFDTPRRSRSPALSTSDSRPVSASRDVFDETPKRRYYSAIEAEAFAAEERRRNQIPLKRAVNRKRLSADASASPQPQHAGGVVAFRDESPAVSDTK